MNPNCSWWTNRSRWIRAARFLIGAAIAIAFTAAPRAKADGDGVHLVTDWSHRHVVFSEPQSVMRSFQLSANHRYVQQWMRRKAERHGARDEWRWRRAPDNPKQLQGDWSMNMGSGATVGAGNYPAKFSFNVDTANCVTPAPPVGQQPDFVVYNTSVNGSASQATIVAFANLYTSCTGGTPQTYWSYNTGTGAAVVTSPVLSRDGSQVAFVQTTATGATLVVLRWKASTGTLGAPVSPAAVGCTALTAPCMTTVAFSTANTDSTPTDNFSSPFYDYEGDNLYVGDDSGFLHKFTGVFGGTPAEVVCTASTVTAGCQLPAGTDLWPANLTTGFGQLNSPVFVGGVNEVFVTATDGVIYVVDSTIGGVYPNGANFLDPKLASPGFDDGPLVDITTNKLYLFARASSEFIDSNAAFGFHGTPNVPSVFQLNIPATPVDIHLTNYVQAIVTDSATIPAGTFNLGAFDDPYYSSTGASGNLYVCSTHNAVNAIWGIPITNNVMGTPFLGPTLTTANVGCSSITEFNNTNTNIDRMFLSVTGSPVTGGACSSSANGCIFSFRIDSPVTPGTAPTARASVAGGTSNIIIDNFSAAGGAAQVYFTPLANQACTTSGTTGGCAIQASQSGLN